MPHRAYHKMTDNHHRYYCLAYLLKAGENQVVASRPEEGEVADITWLPVRNGTAYMSLVTGALSRKIVGYHVHDSLHTHHVSRAFRMALASRRTATPRVAVLCKRVSGTVPVTWHHLFTDGRL